MARHRFWLATAVCCLVAPAVAQTPGKIRGTIASVTDGSVRVTSNGGDDETLTLPADLKITLVEPATLADIKPGSFIGTAAQTQSDGSLLAVEVHVFPESMRGAGEGHRAFDLGPKSTMTNGTVGQEVVGTTGQTLTVRYKGGEQNVAVPAGVPVVTFAPGDRTMLVAGAHLLAFVKGGSDGATVAATILVGKDGLVPPM